MADPSAIYTLNPPTGPDFVFNNGSLKDGVSDVAWLTDVKGLDVAGIRAPFFRQPAGHGGRKPTDWLEEPLHPIFEGAFLIQSEPFGSAGCREKRNVMYAALKAALRACYGTPGQISWTEPGVGAFTLDVNYEVPLERGWDADYAVMTFSFGLFSEASQPVAA